MTLLLFALSDVYVQYSEQPLFVLSTTLHVICVSRYGLINAVFPNVVS